MITIYKGFTMSYEYQFKGRKPSSKQVIKKIKEAVNQGNDLIDIYWGENGLTIQLCKGSYLGWGWIKDISGQDLAEAINRQNKNQLLNLWNT